MFRNKIYFVLVFLLFTHINYGQKSIKYILSKSSIQSVSFQLAPDSTYSILIRLTKEETNKFDEVTKQNVGNLLNIYYSKHNLVSAVVKGEIPNGLISINSLKTSAEVIYYVKILLE